jgi:Immunity protein family (Imm11)
VAGPRIYVPAVQEGYEWVLPVDEADHEVFHGLEGTLRRAGWRPVPICRLTTTRTGAPRAESDQPWLSSHVLVLRDKAVAALGDMLSDHGELLPLSCPDTELWVFNALRLVDALDEGRSTLVRFAGGRIADIQRHVFHPDRVAGVEIFKLPQMPRGWLYLSADFVDRVQSAGLRGVGFDLVWTEGD